MSFNHVSWRPLHYSIGVEICSDFADAAPDDPLHWWHNNVGFWTRGEAKLLRDIAAQFQGHWVEIGAHTGWTAAQIVAGGAHVTSIESMFSYWPFYKRFSENLASELAAGKVMPWSGRSDWYFEHWDNQDGRKFIGACIDGDHEAPHPLRDAINCFDRLEDRGVILLHDFRGPGPWEAGEYLAKQGMEYKIYGSVHMVGVFWRGDFTPPPEIREGKTSDEWIRHYGKPDWAIC